MAAIRTSGAKTALSDKLLCQLAGLALALLAASAHAATFTVSHTGDAGAGSLRQAIADANAMTATGGAACAPHTIVFAIPGAGVHTIRPESALPGFAIGITLNGYSQPGASSNTLDNGNNAVLRIELDGSLAGASHALVIAPRLFMSRGVSCSGSGSVISGLAINRWAGAAILVEGGSDTQTLGGVRIWGNFIGTDATGAVALGNGGALARAAIEFGTNTSGNIVGEQIVDDGGSTFANPSSRNLISGNVGHGVRMRSSDELVPAVSHRVRNAYIGSNAAGTVALANGGHGVFIDEGSGNTQIHDNLIVGNAGNGVTIVGNVAGFTGVANTRLGRGVGDVALGNQGHGVQVVGMARYVSIAGLATVIADNAGAGVLVADIARVQVQGVSIVDNGGLGIDLAPVGVNTNDPLDADDGPNEGLNHPLIDSAVHEDGAQFGTITGRVESLPNASIEVHFHRNDACDPSGSGEGQQLLREGQIPVVVSVVTDAHGHAGFSRQVAFGPPPGQFLTALARTRAASPEPGVPGPFIVSEFSPCRQVDGLLPDPIFANGFDASP